MNSKYLVALNCHPKIGSQTLKKILLSYEDPSSLWLERENQIRAKLGEKIAQFVIEARLKFNPDKEVERLANYDVGYITVFDKGYPKLLKELYDCPVILYVKGENGVLNSLSLGVVGSRKYTSYGKNFSYRFSRDCAQSGLTIVSGLALGIDAFAHQAALDVGGKTVGVLGCGLDNIYPTSNFQLGKSIVENCGAVISEFPLRTPPMKQNFPARNRIIAGLSVGVLVIEAAEKSGALITALQAIENGREVFALPGNIDGENSVGTNRLIQEGAKLVISVEDILKELNITQKIGHDRVKKLIPESKEEKIIIGLLKRDDCLVDDLILKSKLDIISVNPIVTILELKGIISTLSGSRYHPLN
jgi:DNA processing protein